MQIVRQRGEGDCAIAALATVLNKTYEQTAEMIGFELDGNGFPAGVDFMGIGSGELTLPLLRGGYVPVVFITPQSPGGEHPNKTRALHLPTADEIKNILAGRRAVFVVAVEHNGKRYGHALAWDGRRAFDCRPNEGESNLPPIEALAILQAGECWN